MDEPAIEVRGLSHTFRRGRRLPVLQDLSVEAAAGSFVSVVGPSGCGKSTLLRVIAGLLRPDEGESRIHAQSTIGQPGLAAYMPQKDLLLPWRRTLDNATLGAEIAGVPREDAQRRALALVDRFGLGGFERAWPSQLSGGMRQRLALLRTFLMPQRVLLLDEPFGALDAITRRSMHQWLQEVWEEDRRTVLFVTHDVEEALILSDVVYVMTPRPGRIAATMLADYARPRDSHIVTTPAFVAHKAELLDALDRGAGEGAESPAEEH